VYVSNQNSGSVSVIRDTVVPGVQDVAVVPRRYGGGTLTRQIDLPAGVLRADVFDISGRRVARLGPGISHTGCLGVGVYFLAEPGKHGAAKVTIVR
jgi:hypothetical protein